MHVAFSKRWAALFALAAATISLGACSSGAAPSSLPNTSASGLGSNAAPVARATATPPSTRKAQIVGVVGEVSYQDTDVPGGALIAGQSITMTLNLSASSYPVNFGGGFYFNLPSNATAYAITVGGANVLNNCPGVVLNPTTSGYGTLTFLASSTGTLTAPCQIKAFIVAPAAGLYSPGSVIWNGTGPFTLLSGSGTDLTSLTVTAPQDHLYVPIDSTPNQGSVKIFTEEATPKLVCTLSNARIPNPIAVAVNPGFGYIYVIDASGIVVAFRGVNEGTQCNSTPLGGWAVASDAQYLTVDGNNNVIVSGCSGATWYTEQGSYITRFPLTGTPYCDSDVSANYWKNVLYLEQLHKDAITPYLTPPSGPVAQCQISAYGITGYDPTAPEKSWHIAAGSTSNDIVLTSIGSHPHGTINTPQNTVQDVQLLGSCNYNQSTPTFITGVSTNALAYDTFTSDFTAPIGSYVEEYTWPIGPTETAYAFFEGGAHIGYGP